MGQRGFTEIRLLSTFRHIFGNLSLYGEGLLGKVKSWREVGGVWGGFECPSAAPAPQPHSRHPAGSRGFCLKAQSSFS